MTNSKQAGKRVRQNEMARERNKASKSSMKTAMKRVLKAESPEAAKKHYREAKERGLKETTVHPADVPAMRAMEKTFGAG